ncbi:hypothetical protein AB0B50_33320 [Streptomyces sp. NPDC041068]|uniref:hypothetical protein n=1 Tax=Streptomyces sp. NPDC041068 TaxID=3155130 RepID=UPI0033FACD3B
MPGQDRDFDALMSAITDEPLPEEALRDPDFAAAHAAAVADVTLLRERLGAAGDALAAGPAPREEAVPIRAPRSAARHRFTVALGTAAATLAAVVVGGLAYLAVDAGQGAMDDEDASKGAASEARGGDGSADADLTPEGFVACSRLIVEGTVTAVDAVPGAGRDRITLDVSRYIKPLTGDDTVVFPMDHDVDPRLRTGDRVLITIPRGEAEPDNWATGKDRTHLRTMIDKALPGSKKIRCDR